MNQFSRRAFTLIELLVVVAVIGILAGLLLPSLSRAKTSAQAISCVNNLKQLQLAWHLYADDHNDRMPPHHVDFINNEATDVTGSWVLGHARLDLTTSNIEHGVLFPFSRSVVIYRCPADKSFVTGHRNLPRTRSCALNWHLGAVDELSASRRIKLKTSQLTRPSEIYAFIDEDQESINDGSFWLPPDEIGDMWGDIPSDRHALGANLSFTDGHVDRWRWKWKKAGIKHFDLPINPLDLDDLHRLHRATPEP